jgi:hypothetical protein
MSGVVRSFALSLVLLSFLVGCHASEAPRASSGDASVDSWQADVAAPAASIASSGKSNDAVDAGLTTSVSTATTARLGCLAKYFEARVEGEGLVLSNGRKLAWDDGKTKTPAQRFDDPDLEDMLAVPYKLGPIAPVTREEDDPGRPRVEPLFTARYGETPDKVLKSLVMVKFVGTSVGFHRLAAEPLRRVSAKIEKLIAATPDLAQYFKALGGTYNARKIAGTERVSAHTWGIAIDIDTSVSDYWRYALPKQPVWKNRIPQPIVDAFESEGFVWGGRWYHYDTMHFEYRPELFDAACKQ